MPPNNIPQIYVNSTGGLRYLSPIETGTVTIANINTPWIINPPQAIPWSPPVTVNIGVPVVEMPGCVKIHKENAKNPSNKSSTLVNDDPNQNVVLCDGGMPYYEPPDIVLTSLLGRLFMGNQKNRLVV